MSLKEELQIWSDGLKAFDNQDFGMTLQLFESIASSSKILFNMGLVHAMCGDHQQALDHFEQAVALDPYLAIAYFQAGVSHFLLGQFGEARRGFDEAFLYLRKNQTIDYEQLGLKFKLYSCEVLFNRGLALLYMGEIEEGMQDISTAMQEKQTEEHRVIDEAYLDRGEGYTVFSVSLGTLFRPSATKIKNLETKDYLGKAKIVAAADPRDLFIGFSGTHSQTQFEPPANRKRQTGETGGATGLARSKTSAARLEKSGDGVAAPLRQRLTAEEMCRGGRGGGSGADDRLRRSQTAGPIPAASTSRPAGALSETIHKEPKLSSLIGSSDERATRPPVRLALPQLKRSPTTAINAYAVVTSGDILEGYYANSPKEGIEEESLGDLARSVQPLHVSRKPSHGLAAPASTILMHPHPHPHPAPLAFVPSAQVPQRVSNSAPRNSKPRLAPLSLPPSSLASVPSLSRNNVDSSTDSRTPSDYSPVTESSLDYAASGGKARLVRELHQQQQQRGLARQDSVSSAYGGAVRVANGSTRGGGMITTEIGEQLALRYAPSSSGEREMTKARIKLRYQGDVRGMSITPDMPHENFVERVRFKFGNPSDLRLKYKDSDGGLVSILDADDWESAMDQAREAANGRAEGKLEVIILGED
ncbi:hypothetical protein JCM1841_003978 [Sporobolomyces salmonicolor]